MSEETEKKPRRNVDQKLAQIESEVAQLKDQYKEMRQAMNNLRDTIPHRDDLLSVQQTQQQLIGMMTKIQEKLDSTTERVNNKEVAEKATQDVKKTYNSLFMWGVGILGSAFATCICGVVWLLSHTLSPDQALSDNKEIVTTLETIDDDLKSRSK